MWKPNQEGFEELLSLLKDSKSKDTKIHQIIYKKINDYSNEKDFTKYLVYILNEEDVDADIRQLAGLTMKAIMERSFINLSEDSIEYFKCNILNCYNHSNYLIRKTISNLINTFIRHGGTEMWPEILTFLYDNLDSSISVEMSLETINIIIEDSASYLEEKHIEFLQNLSPKLSRYLKSISDQKDNQHNENLINLALISLHIMLENCPNAMSEYVCSISEILISLHEIKNLNIRFRIGRCWLVIDRINKGLLFSTFDNQYNFFYKNLLVENYEMNFTSAEFLLYLVDEEEDDIIKNNNVSFILQSNLKNLLPFILHYMNLTANDICGIDSKIYSEKNDDDEEKVIEAESYNPNWTLRKCCSKFLDRLSYIYPRQVLEVIKPHLEENMQNSNWNIKERSILALGAVANGCSIDLKQHLSTLIPFLIRELQHPHKLVRAISLWTLSRFTKFIMIDNLSENSNEIFKDYLCETLKRFLDKELIVQDAACTAFTSMLQTGKEKLEPYLFDIFKIITSVFNVYTGNSLLTLFDLISLITEHFEEHFKNPSLVTDIIKCATKKWYSLINSDDLKNVSPIFDMICSIIRVSSNLMLEYVNDFINGSIRLMELNLKNFEKDSSLIDKEVVSKCIDLISVLCQSMPEVIKKHQRKNKIIELSFKLLETDNSYIKHYIIALFGDICQVDANLLLPKLDYLVEILIKNLDLSNKYETIEIEKLSVCNNSCWTLGLLALSLQKELFKYVNTIMKSVIKILCFPKLNKSLAQNVSICIGRLAIINPEVISDYIDSFLKQFCLSLRYINNSQEKQDAFKGLCKSIINNPNGVINYFAFFCDAICQYDNAPIELETTFQNLIFSYKNTLKEKWMDYYNLFPDKLKKKMNSRFKLN